MRLAAKMAVIKKLIPKQASKIFSKVVSPPAAYATSPKSPSELLAVALLASILASPSLIILINHQTKSLRRRGRKALKVEEE
jgi:hypothetical protein